MRQVIITQSIKNYNKFILTRHSEKIDIEGFSVSWVIHESVPKEVMHLRWQVTHCQVDGVGERVSHEQKGSPLRGDHEKFGITKAEGEQLMSGEKPC